MSNLVRLVDPEEIAAARHLAGNDLITDGDPFPKPAHDQIDADERIKPH